MRFYVIPAMTFTVVDIIPSLVYPKPYLGLGFKERTSDTVARTPSEGEEWQGASASCSSYC